MNNTETHSSRRTSYQSTVQVIHMYIRWLVLFSSWKTVPATSLVPKSFIQEKCLSQPGNKANFPPATTVKRESNPGLLA